MYDNIIHIKEVYTMALATLSAKVDSNNKKEFEQFCEDTGMNVSVCINMFVKHHF